MSVSNNSALKGNSRALRKNMTKEERHLWLDFLKKSSWTVHKQKVISNYIVDFYIAEAKLIIELDGSQHYEDAGMEKDRMRDTHLKELGYNVARYTNLDINRNFRGVCEDITRKVAQYKGEILQDRYH